MPFDIAFHHATPHGVLSAVDLPATVEDRDDPVPAAVLDRLHPDERAHALTLGGLRRVSFVGGRLALRAAAAQLGLRLHAVLPDDRGAPVPPPGFAVSISHKRTLAVGMVARDTDGTLGVDLEESGPPRLRIADRVLRPEELEAIAPLPDDRRWIALLLRFSTKESVYKAVDPYVRRWVGFDEASVTPGLTGRSTVRLHLARGEGPFDVDARYHWLRGWLLTSVRIQRRPDDQPAVESGSRPSPPESP